MEDLQNKVSMETQSQMLKTQVQVLERSQNLEEMRSNGNGGEWEVFRLDLPQEQGVKADLMRNPDQMQKQGLEEDSEEDVKRISKASLFNFGFTRVSKEEHLQQTSRSMEKMKREAAARTTIPLAPVKSKRSPGRPKKLVDSTQVLSIEQFVASSSKKKESVKLKGKRPEKYVNWFKYELWNKIERAMKQKKFVLREVVKHLKVKYGGTFLRLNESTLRTWIKKGKRQLTDKVAQAAKFVKEKPGTSKNPMARGSQPFWEDKRDLEADFKTLVCSVRDAGQILNSVVIQVLLLGFLGKHKPDLLAENGGVFEASRSFIRSWCTEVMGWTFRAGTTNPSKLPNKWEELIEKMALRISYLVAAYKIPPALVINADQTGVHLLPITGEKTYAPKGSNKVAVAGAGDKRAISLMVGSSAAGDLLPFQAIYSGTTKRSLPCEGHTNFLTSRGWHMTCTQNHWSSLATMKDYVVKIIWPHYVSVCQSQGLQIGKQKLVLLLDCWAVHKSKEYTDWLKEAFPIVCLVFVPGGCTGIAQPADVVLQRPIKCAIHRGFSKWAASQVVEKLSTGHSTSMVGKSELIDQSMGNLRNRSCEWLFAAYQIVGARREMIQGGWRKCGILQAFEPDFQQRAFDANRAGELFVKDEIVNSNWTEDLPTGFEEEWFGDISLEESMLQE